MLDVYSSTWMSLPGTKKATLLRTHSRMHILHPLGQRHHTFHRCCMVLNWPQPSQFPLSPSPGPALERSSSAESRKVKMEEAWKYVSICIAARVTLFTPQPPLLPPGAFINQGFQLLRFSSGSSSGVPTLILHKLDNDIWVFLGSRNCRVLQAYCMFGFTKIIHVAGSAQCLFGSERFLHQKLPLTIMMSPTLSLPADCLVQLPSPSLPGFSAAPKPLVLSYSAPESQS